MMRLNLQVKLYPTKQMRTYLDSQCDYRRYCWNQGLKVWNDIYDQRVISLPTDLKLKIKESLKDKSIPFTEEEMNLRKEFPSPTERHVRNELVANKSDWEYENSSRVLQLAVKDLSDTWIRFFKKSQESSSKPKFKRRKEPKQGFKTDSARIKNGRLLLDKPRAYTGPWESIRFKGHSIPDGAIKLCAITRVKNQYLATISINVETTPLTPTGKVTAVDANVDHFDYTDGVCTLRPQELNRLYGKVKHYQRVLARMQMFKKAKGLHRSLFGRFRLFMEYKAEKFERELVIADKYYPSTQRCSSCGHIKTDDEKITLAGNQKHGTRHDEYHCYQCGYQGDRDYNAVLNLLALI